ncbi:unnamed protein product [Amoebophrya sp. A25]|nr:unnamed protein product [Amoebophrya sp. A25]|eukprot:GSA25T00019577001.1
MAPVVLAGGSVAAASAAAEHSAPVPVPGVGPAARGAITRSKEQQLRRLHAEIEQTTRKLELAKRRVLKLQDDISKAKREHEALYQSRRDATPTRSSAESNERSNDNKAAKALLKLDSLTFENNALRKKIEGVRRDRLQCNLVLKKVKDALREKERSIASLEETAQEAREDVQKTKEAIGEVKQHRERDYREWKHKLRTLQEQLRMERARALGSRAAPSSSGSGRAAPSSSSGGGVVGSGVSSSLPAIEDATPSGGSGTASGANGGTTTGGGAGRAAKKLTINVNANTFVEEDQHSPMSPNSGPKRTALKNSNAGGNSSNNAANKTRKQVTVQPPGGTPGGGTSGIYSSSSNSNNTPANGSSSSSSSKTPLSRRPLTSANKTAEKHIADQGKKNLLSPSHEDRSEFSEHRFMRLIFKAAFCNAIQRRHIKQHQKSIQVYEQAFDTIKSSTGISDIEEIVKIFTKLEERNYSLLVYVNMLSQDIEEVQRKKQQLLLERGEQQEKSSALEKKRAHLLEGVQRKVDRYKELTSEMQHRIEQSKIPDSVQDMVVSISCTLHEQNVTMLRQQQAGSSGAFSALTQHPCANAYTVANMHSVNPFGEDAADVKFEDYLVYIEQVLTQWREYLPIAPALDAERAIPKPFPYTVAHEVKTQLAPKRAQLPTLLRIADLPSANLTDLRQGKDTVASVGGGSSPERKKDDEDSDDEEDRALSKEELQAKVNAALSKRKKKHANVRLTAHRRGSQDEDALAKIRAGETGGETSAAKAALADDVSDKSSSADLSDSDSSSFSSSSEEGPTDEQINEIFLKRYKMSKADLVALSEKMGIALNNLCYLKQEFDLYDEDSSGFIDLDELRELLSKLGEDLSEEELLNAFKELDSDCSGEIEFFEFVEWFTSEE